jgi:hypothetical protein
VAVSGNKEIRAALPPGYSLQPGKKHMHVIGPDGTPARGIDGRPLVVAKGGKPNRVGLASQLRQLRAL